MEVVFQVSRSPLWLSLFIWLSDVTFRFKAAAWQLQGEENQPQNSRLGNGHVPAPHWITHLSIFKGRASFSKIILLSEPWDQQFLFQFEPPMNWHNSPSGNGKSWKISEFPTIWSNFVMERHGSSTLWAKKLVGFFDSTQRSRLAASSQRPRSFTFFVVQPQRKICGKSKVSKHCDFTMWSSPLAKCQCAWWIGDAVAQHVVSFETSTKQVTIIKDYPKL